MIGAWILWCALTTGAQGPTIDLNHASADELMQLPGIGAKKATGIIALREKHPLRRPTEIMRVRGIGPKLYTRIKDRLRIEPVAPGQPHPAPIDVQR